MSSAKAEASTSEEGGRRPLPRWSLLLVAGLHGLIFAWAGAKLPWSEWSSFAIVCYALALGHGLTALAAALSLRALTPIWRSTAVLGLAVLGWLAWELTSAASYLAGLYGSLGEGIGAGLLALIGLAALLTLPISAWGLAATWERSLNKGGASAAAVLACLWTLGALRQSAEAEATELPLPAALSAAREDGEAAMSEVFRDQLAAQLVAALGGFDQLPKIPRGGAMIRKGKRELLRVPATFVTEPVACVPTPGGAEAAAVLTYLAPLAEGADPPEPGHAPVEAVSRCVRAAPEQLLAAIVDQLAAEALRAPIKIDLLTGVAPLQTRSPVLDPFALRPGRDGVCDQDMCLMPWQLVALEQFVLNEPLPWVPDFRYGVSPVALRHALGFEVPEEVLRWDREQRNVGRLSRLEEAGKATARPADADSWLLLEELSRLETLSMVITDAGELLPLIRMHPRELELTQARLDRGRALAENHIAKAQLRSGRFRYLLDPFTGEQETRSWNLPRQAGTTLVMCERGRDPRRVRRVAKRSLAFMAEHARPIRDLTPLVRRARSSEAQLGATALPAIAFFACREHVGDVHDELLGGLTRFLLAMQREDGSFYPAYETVDDAVIDGPEPMYAGGQAIFALSLAQELALEQPEIAEAAGLPSAEVLHEAVERAMNFYTGPYWDTFPRDFFWLEENWHCLAARASLGHHRNAAYEQFCVDYMSYKARVVLDESSRVDREFHGSYAFGNILTPVNTPAAGFGEGLAAAMAIRHARGEDLEAERAQMREVIAFLLRMQWNEDSCFACTPSRAVTGGFSESMSAPEIRIDFTQHAWAALGHGGDWIYDELPPE